MVDVQKYVCDGVLYFLITVLDKKSYTHKNTHFKFILLLHILQPQGREGESDPTKKDIITHYATAHIYIIN
jgi:hypothetical protein